MKQRIVRFSVRQTSKVVVILYGIFCIFLILPLVIASLTQSGQSLGIGLMLIVLVFYLALGYIFTIIACWLYNTISRWAGGIEVTTEMVILPEEIKCPICQEELKLKEDERIEEKFSCPKCKGTFIIKD